MDQFEGLLETVKQHLLDSSRQNWLFGAGISLDAKIPLMYPLTTRVVDVVDENKLIECSEILKGLQSSLIENSHIEHYLSHLGDLIAIAERSRNSNAYLNGNLYELKTLQGAYKEIIKIIGNTVRLGYKTGTPSEVGTLVNPIVDIKHHVKFIESLFSKRANLERRSTINFFTTNYDTLLEDALALNKKVVIDGFSGGTVGFWNPETEFNTANHNTNHCFLYKLHGSIDWYKDESNRLFRVRHGTTYFSDPSNTMIYPQATKYVETQRDPFAYLFLGLRETLMKDMQNVLLTCGYSFGDEHINAEIEACLDNNENKTTIIAFIKETPDAALNILINKTLDKWLINKKFGKRIFVAGENGIYNNSLTPVNLDPVKLFSWWTFQGLSKFIEIGEI